MAGKSSIPGLTLLIMLHVILVLGFIGEQWVNGSLERERSSNAAFFGDTQASYAEARATQWFSGLLVDTGISTALFGAMLPSEAYNDAISESSAFTPFFSWWEGRLRTWWTLLYQAFLRISTALLWMPYALFVIAPFIVDGAIRRKIKQTDFRMASPLQHRLNVLAIKAVVLGYAVLLFLPIALKPIFLPLLILITGAALGNAVGHFAKRA